MVSRPQVTFLAITPSTLQAPEAWVSILAFLDDEEPSARLPKYRDELQAGVRSSSAREVKSLLQMNHRILYLNGQSHESLS